MNVSKKNHLLTAEISCHQGFIGFFLGHLFQNQPGVTLNTLDNTTQMQYIDAIYEFYIVPRRERLFSVFFPVRNPIFHRAFQQLLSGVKSKIPLAFWTYLVHFLFLPFPFRLLSVHGPFISLDLAGSRRFCFVFFILFISCCLILPSKPHLTLNIRFHLRLS